MAAAALQRLTGETPDDWMNIFGIADNASVDESPEAETYAVGVREAFKPDLTHGAVGVDLDSAHEVIRLSFAKTAEGAAEIAGWAEGTSTDLSALDAFPTVPPTCPPADDGDDDGGLDAAMLAEAAGAGGGLGILFFLLFLV